ncbi:hypothetical protein NKR19_g3749 [Coniochaeta hoffmannii]|uniref:Large ribosomal subunit protein mL49 n=1 Tax=Coniochaeta hoffmannii TaxID=91930 RepID=A0AA38S864_9PEZI|nr:hypothetical protein NKR19_g3749 [Coniochaeta hoffmannii]
MLRQTFLRRAAPMRLLNLQTSPAFSVPLCRRLTTSPSSSPDSSSSSTSPPPLSATPTPETAPASSRPPYLVSRTPSLNLPVYTETKRGGNKKLTVLKKIEGDARALKEALRAELKLEDGQIRINHVTGHIEIAGFRKEDVASFLAKQGF